MTTSRANAATNGFDDRYVALLPEDEPSATYPLVVANILAGTLIELQPLLASRVAPGGTLMLSGIWGAEQRDAVTRAYAGDFERVDAREQDGWVLLVCSRRR